MKKERKKRIERRETEVVNFMTEFARFLVAAGISSARFSRIAKLAYFQAASLEGKFLNARVNQSAVAAMTGLTRSQVRAFLRGRKSFPSTDDDRLERLISGWASDAEFITSTLNPRRLRITGSGSSFPALVRRYGGDLPPRSVLRELERRLLVVRSGEYVQLSNAARNQRKIRRLQQLAGTLAQVIRGDEWDITDDLSMRAIAMEVSFPTSSSAGRILLQRRISKSIKAFIAELEAAGNAVAMESPPPASRKGSMSQARLLLLTRDSKTRFT
jgi:Family of unknown function (DUF6502)